MVPSSYAFTSLKCVIGLGNPGPRFELTRHNMGFLVLDALADQFGGSWREKENAWYTEITVAQDENMHTVCLVKPQTFMNNSGAVWSWLAKKGIRSDEVLVVHDELEKTFGALHLRLGGSARGHNGLRSLIQAMGEQFWRLRVGIGRPAEKHEVSTFVLQRFTPHELAQLTEVVTQAASLIVSEK